ncbi:ATP-binding protein [Puteibacter caeruleilacunae]|nr:ATP-binding protein [Puteibacter caeruleilacunae]
MLINFSVTNFGPIKEQQTLSFEADSSSHLEDYFLIPTKGNLRLLKLGLIYGANASGKTTVLRALEFLRDLVLEPYTKKTSRFDFKPFLFDPQTPNENTVFTIEFLQNNIKYFYELELNNEAIIREELFNFNPNRANVFKRTTDVENEYSEISFGSKIKKSKAIEKSLTANTLWNNTVLGGFLKTNVEQNELKEVTDWFSDYLKALIYTRTDLEAYVTSQIGQSDIKKEDVVNILKKADLNISDIIINAEEKDIPAGVLEIMEKQAGVPKDKLSELKNKGKHTTFDLEFQHTVDENDYTLSFEDESEGTRRYYGFAGLLSMLVHKSALFSIDELEASLHPDLFTHFILSFLMNSTKSQLLATTHNREILSNRDIFRNDAIWITDKSECCSTELYSLADFDTSVIRDTSNVYNAYKIGKLGGVPNLGDHYIDTENEKD